MGGALWVAPPHLQIAVRHLAGAFATADHDGALSLDLDKFRVLVTEELSGSALVVHEHTVRQWCSAHPTNFFTLLALSLISLSSSS